MSRAACICAAESATQFCTVCFSASGEPCAYRLTARSQSISNARREIGLIKVYGAGVLHDVVDRALQVHGSLGYSTDLPLEAMYRYARAARLYDGPDEVHRQSVARQVLRGYEPPPGEVPSEHVPTRREAARRRFAQVLDAVTANE